MTRERPRWLLLLLAALSVGCATPPPSTSVHPDVAPQPPASTGSASQPRTQGSWWQAYADPNLAQLIEAAQADNAPVHELAARLSQARLSVDVARQARHPRASLQGRGAFSRSISAFGEASVISTELTLPVTYEISLFGAGREDQRAAEVDVHAAEVRLENARLVVTFDVAEAYFGLVEARLRAQALDRQVELNEEILASVERRHTLGLIAITDVHQQRQQVAATRRLRQRASTDALTHEQRLAVLLGPAQRVALADLRFDGVTLPDPPRTASSLPPSAWRRRPDVREAELRIRAAGHRAKATRARRLPKVTVDANPGLMWQRAAVGDLPAQVAAGPTFVGGAGFAIPLLGGSASRAQVDAAKAAVDIERRALDTALHAAAVETEHSLRLEALQRDALVVLEEQRTTATDALTTARAQFEEGLVGYIDVLNALVRWQTAELDALEGQRALVVSRIGVHRAVGGPLPTPSAGDTP